MPSGSAFDELPGGLPPGSLVEPDPDYFDDPTWSRDVLWVSEERLPDVAEHWLRLFESRSETGLHPLLLAPLDSEPERPWHAGELSPAPVGAIDVLNGDGVLRRFWAEVAEEAEEADGRWPGLAGPGAGGRDPDEAARGLVGSLAREDDWLLGLVPAGRGADTPALVGWDGACEHCDYPQEISAVLRSWEDRFGACVVALGFDTLDLSVAAPPDSVEHARRVAAEHLAFCPDAVWEEAETLDEYAKGLVGVEHWSFWWD